MLFLQESKNCSDGLFPAGYMLHLILQNIIENTYVTYSRTYKVKGIDVTITDERIGEAIQFIMPNQRAVLLLSFFKEYSDMDIARLMKISHKTVAYRKQMAMKKLRQLLEGIEDGC